MIIAFIDELRTEGHAVESICRVLREQDCQIAARTYRDWTRSDRPVATRTISDAIVTNVVRAPPVDAGGPVRAAQDDRFGTPLQPGRFTRCGRSSNEIIGFARNPAVQRYSDHDSIQGRQPCW